MVRTTWALRLDYASYVICVDLRVATSLQVMIDYGERNSY